MPALILFPGQIVVMAEALGIDVTWSHDGNPEERFCYQLIAGHDPAASEGYQIAVLTPMATRVRNGPLEGL